MKTVLGVMATIRVRWSENAVHLTEPATLKTVDQLLKVCFIISGKRAATEMQHQH